MRARRGQCLCGRPVSATATAILAIIAVAAALGGCSAGRRLPCLQHVAYSPIRIVPDSINWPPATGDSILALYVTVAILPKQRLALSFGSIVAASCCLLSTFENPDWHVTSFSASPRNSTVTGVLR